MYPRYLLKLAAMSGAALVIAQPFVVSAQMIEKKPAASAQNAPSLPPEDTAPPPPSAADSAPPPPSEAPLSSAPDAAKMSPSKTVVENASNSPDHTTLVTAVKSAGLAETLSAAGPFTVFAPSNDGFGRLPPGTVDTLMKPENQGALNKILSNHVVSGKITAADLAKKIKSGNGKATFTTVAGNTLTATAMGGSIKITDDNNNASEVTKADIMASNGIIHSINGVLIPGEKKAAQPPR